MALPSFNLLLHRHWLGSKAVTGVALLAALASAGCGGGSDKANAGASEGTAASTGGGTTAAPAPGASAPSNPGPVTTAGAPAGPCVGTATPALDAVILPPAVPVAQADGELVGLQIQNTSAVEQATHRFSFAQVFRPAQLQTANSLVAHIGGKAYQAQADTLATWPDGSVKLASITLATPPLCAGATVPVMLAKTTATYPTFRTEAVDLAKLPLSLTVNLAFTGGPYAGTREVDLGAALKASLSNNPDVWLKGPLATQARIDVPLAGGSLHLTADVTAYADGTLTADVQFNNDLTTVLPQSGRVNPQGALPPLQYDATVNLQGRSFAYPGLRQLQYTDWHVVVGSLDTPATTAASRRLPLLNVQHDLAHLQRSGAVMPYDRTTGVANESQPGNALSLIANVRGRADFGLPLTANGVTPYMPMTGGRADIGYTTLWNTVWLLTQDARAASVGLAQSDTSGAIPWNHKLTNGHWLTPGDHPSIWLDGRGGPHGFTDGIANTADRSNWATDGAHQPNLNYVPYLATGSRWNLDRLNAQAAVALSGSWPGNRCRPTPCASPREALVLNGGDEVRHQAWGMREVQQAAFIGKPGSFEHTYFNKVVQDNWNYARSQQARLMAAGGQVYGHYGLASYSEGMRLWQQDYLTGVAAQGAQMGFTGARDFIGWQKSSWLAARFIAPDANPYDGCVYLLTFGSGTTPLTSWAAIRSATLRDGRSNAPGTWTHSDGSYCATARSALGLALTVYPNDPDLTQALRWLNVAGAPNTDPTALRRDPTFNVVPLQ
ncbi:MAG: hypothetical protein V4739_06540 [Pseudomonadota bacterium]